MEKKYRVTIEEIVETQDTSYPKKILIYEQTILALDIENVIKAWKIIKEVNVFEVRNGERREGQKPAFIKIVSQCEKCGKIKNKQI